ncbi:MAG: M20/M25/M40 family metallo-hydrolase [Curvibacter sp.]|nr:M20/M25/M40 family metallo-hydrolase [Curvibacter sp.]
MRHMKIWTLAGGLALAGAAQAQYDAGLLRLAQAHKAALTEDLGVVVNMDSGTDDAAGLAKVEGMLAQRLRVLGADVEVRSSPPAAGRTIIGTLHGEGTKNILLMIHYDTVFGIGDAAKRPFKVVGNKAFGPGVADAKGGALLILHALDLLRERQFRAFKTLTVLFNPDEEKSSLGSRSIIQKLSADQDFVLVFEPPESERVTVGTNGIAYVHLDVQGRASHAGSAPEAGRNAAIELAHQLLQLNDLGSTAKGTTVNWTVVQAGGAVNIIPEKAGATADMRMSDPSEIARVQADADRLIQKKLIPETQVSVRVEDRRPPFGRNESSDSLAALAKSIYAEMGRPLTAAAMRYGTDAGFAYNPASPAKPVVLDGMGIVGDRIHSSDEWADLDSIVPRLYLTVRMIEAMSVRN